MLTPGDSLGCPCLDGRGWSRPSLILPVGAWVCFLLHLSVLQLGASSMTCGSFRAGFRSGPVADLLSGREQKVHPVVCLLPHALGLYFFGYTFWESLGSCNASSSHCTNRKGGTFPWPSKCWWRARNVSGFLQHHGHSIYRCVDLLKMSYDESSGAENCRLYQVTCKRS